jgi:hypothetical protein
MSLFESAEDREANNSALLVDHRSIAGRDEALTELGHALRVNCKRSRLRWPRC